MCVTLAVAKALLPLTVALSTFGISGSRSELFAVARVLGPMSTHIIRLTREAEATLRPPRGIHESALSMSQPRYRHRGELTGSY